MAYRFSQDDQPVSHQVRRIFLEELHSAIGNLKSSGIEIRDQRIHEARKNIKKIRALLRLVSCRLRGRDFRQFNRAFRNIGRKLAGLRDAQAILESFAALPEGALPVAIRNSMQERLQADKARVYEVSDVDELFRFCVSSLEAVRSQLISVPLEEGAYSTLEPAIVATYRAGRKAFKRAILDETAENLHNFRKRVKDHWYHVRLLSESQGEFLAKRQEPLHQLETVLGEGHNLHVLQQKLLRIDHKKVGGVSKTLKAREDELNTQAANLGQILYAYRTQKFAEQLSSSATRVARSKPPVRESSKTGEVAIEEQHSVVDI